VSTGPRVEAFLADGTFQQAYTGARTEVLRRDAWPGRTRGLTLRPTAQGGLGETTPAAGTTTFAGDPRGVASPQGTGGATFTTVPLERDLVLAGLPELRLSASVTAARGHLIATLFDEDPDGVRRRITQCAINAELRNGIARRDVVVRATRYDTKPPCYAMAHRVRAGRRLTLRMTTSDPDKVPLFAIDPRVNVFSGEGATALTVPVVDAPRTVADAVSLTERAGAQARGETQRDDD